MTRHGLPIQTGIIDIGFAYPRSARVGKMREPLSAGRVSRLFTHPTDVTGFHGTWRRDFPLQGSFVFLFEKRLADAVIDKIPGKQFI